jgi:uncharacterized membrane protein YagU involved in acid resistance
MSSQVAGTPQSPKADASCPAKTKKKKEKKSKLTERFYEKEMTWVDIVHYYFSVEFARAFSIR